MIAQFVTAILLIQAGPSEFLAENGGQSVPDAIAGLEWGELSSDHLPHGIEMQVSLLGERDEQGSYRFHDFTLHFQSGVIIDGGGSDDFAVIGGCRTANNDVFVMPFASFCRFTNEYRLAVLSLIALGYEDISMTGEFRSWPVDMAELNITRDEIMAFAQEASALYQTFEANPDAN